MDRVLAIAPPNTAIPKWRLPSFEVVPATGIPTSLDALDGFDVLLLWPQQADPFLTAAGNLLQSGGNTIPLLLVVDDSIGNLAGLVAELDGFIDLRWPDDLVEASLHCAVRSVRLGRNIALIQKAVLAEARTQAATLYRRAVRDGLTELYNRRHLDEILPREHARAKRHGEGYALAIFDVDDLKMINTCFGHDAGSRVLSEAANLLRSRLRPSDYAFRYGGDEFVVLLPRTDNNEALGVVRHIVKEASSLRLTCAGKEVPCRLSAGVAAFEGGEETPEAVFQRADAALGYAKKAGKGRVGA